MNITEALRELEKAGSEQTRRTYARHGIKGAMFGVSYAALALLKKKIKTDHALAKQLWSSGNHDARVLATMIADADAITEAELEAWVGELEDYVLTDALAGLAAQSAYARKKMAQWTRSSDECISSTGWSVLARLAIDAKQPDDLFEPFITRIEKEIHQAPNRARYSMNGALIAIGGRGATLTTRALAAARRIGPVQVDHGDTECKTPDAVEYIGKLAARRAGKSAGAKKPTRKAPKTAARARVRA